MGRFFAASEKAHRRALALHEQLLAEFPGDDQKSRLVRSHGQFAWLLVTRTDREPRHIAEALIHARKALDLSPADDDRWHTLGVALCRAGQWREALAALEKSRDLQGKDHQS